MDLIRDDDDAALVAEMSQTAQGVGIPTDARRVVGIGEDEHAAFGVADRGELVEVHGVGAPLPPGGGCFYERVIDYLAAVAQWGEAEGMIYGGWMMTFSSSFTNTLIAMPMPFTIPGIYVIHSSLGRHW